MEIMYPIVIVICVIFGLAIFFINFNKKKQYINGKKVANTKYIKETEYYKTKVKKYKIVSNIIKTISLICIIISSILIARPVTIQTKSEDKYNRDILISLDVSTSESKVNLELVKKFKESISQEESELVDRFKEYLQIAIMSIKNNESKFINKDDESIRSVVTKMANDLIYASLETKKRVLIEDKNLIRINEYSNQAYKDATKIVMGDSEAIEYDIDKRIDEINYLLEEVKEYNKDIAKKMVSEIILDLNFIKNPKTGITSLRLGHFIRDYENANNKEEER